MGRAMATKTKSAGLKPTRLKIDDKFSARVADMDLMDAASNESVLTLEFPRKRLPELQRSLTSLFAPRRKSQSFVVTHGNDEMKLAFRGVCVAFIATDIANTYQVAIEVVGKVTLR